MRATTYNKSFQPTLKPLVGFRNVRHVAVQLKRWAATRMRLLTVSLTAWLTGTAAYVLVAGGPFHADSLAGLPIYGAMFSALPAVIAFWLVLVPLFRVLQRRDAAPSSFIGCLGVAVVANTIPPTASGPLSGEALRFYLVFGLVGLVLGAGYLWSRPRVAA